MIRILEICDLHFGGGGELWGEPGVLDFAGFYVHVHVHAVRAAV